MPSPTLPQNPFRLSLRAMLVWVAAAALAIASMTYASDWWEIGVATLLLVVFVAAAIVALADRGPPQAFAVGMVVVMMTYAGLLAYASLQTAREFNPEFDGRGQLITSRLLATIHDSFVDRRYVDLRSGKEIPDFDPVNLSRSQLPARRVDTPPLREFMKIGHAWSMLLLACLGGQFARAVYLCRAAHGGNSQ